MWSRRDSRSDIEARLRSRRAEASPEFVDGLAGKLAPGRRPTARAWSRLAFASAVSVFILGTFASFGGMSYAASGASETYAAVHQVVVKHKLDLSVRTSSAAGQYPKSPTAKPAAVHVKKKTQHAGVLGAGTVSGGTLPFTGVSLLGTFVVSLALIGGGILLRRREGRS
jgi:hypothetical protein